MEFTFAKLPETAAEFTSMPEYGFDSPLRVAALYIAAICAFPKDREACYAMIDAIKGPAELNPADKNFIRDRMMDKADYLGKAYFKGATPQNNYTPTLPYTVIVKEDTHSYDTVGYATVYLTTAGADNPRPVQLRQKGNEWFLWQHQGVLAGIRIPIAEDAWA
jgi:hypothetical protein